MSSKNHFTLFLFLSIMVFSGCKSSKIVTGGVGNLNLSAKQLIKENAKTSANFKTLQSRLKITYTEGEKSQSYSVAYRMEKDKVLWMSATLGIVRAKITPERVAFYNKLDNTYFEGDFEYFSKLLGTDLDFEKVQNILLGDPLFNLKDEAYKLSIDKAIYQLEPKRQKDLFSILFLLNPSHYKVQSQQITQAASQRHLQIDYVAYQEVEQQLLPELVKVTAVEGKSAFVAQLEFKSMQLNTDLRFPFKIPSGFKKIVL